ncbi:DgyrCDS5016 [Dimorphilus gyrociliatus]|nr:DgyrCDS5016 [Dimorphilus gyrociliatus]
MKSCSNPTEDGEYKYWGVNLDGEYNIHTITIYGREGCCGDHYQDLYVNVYENDEDHAGRGGKLCKHFVSDKPPPRPFNITCDKPVAGWYVEIYSKYRLKGYKNLQLCEVYLYGSKVDKEMKKKIQTSTTNLTHPCDEDSCGYRCITFKSHKVDRIYGGKDAVQNSWPWMAGIFSKYTNNIFCGASIIGKRWLITAAHCAQAGDEHKFIIVVGAHNSKLELATSNLHMRKLAIKRFIPHEIYSIKYTYDMMLIELEEDLQYTDEVFPVCLPKDHDILGESCIATGWGQRNTGDPYDINYYNLQEVELKIHDDDSCLEHFRAYLTAEFCAGATDGKDTCFGDSGGPLVCPKNGIFYLYGLTSYGSSKCGGNTAVYTRVTNLREWIKKHTNL